MKINLNIKDSWIEVGSNPRRVQTLDEAIEELCENCLDSEAGVEIDVDGWVAIVCRECASLITAGHLSNSNFVEDINIAVI